jgi:hypothetical protein
MGLPLEPAKGVINAAEKLGLPLQVSPALKRIESPGLYDPPLTFVIVFQGEEADVPLLESVPLEDET